MSFVPLTKITNTQNSYSLSSVTVTIQLVYCEVILEKLAQTEFELRERIFLQTAPTIHISRSAEYNRIQRQKHLEDYIIS